MQLAAGFMTMPCADLQQVSIPGGTITSVSAVPAGLFTPPRAAGPPDGGPPAAGPPNAPRRAPEQLPAHCRVTLVLTPTSDSNINVELWLPTEQWNGKFLAVGNGGWAGSITGYADMAAALRRGYATAGTDTGHSAADGAGGMFALGHPEKIVDFAYRAIHDMTVKSKRIIDVFYATPLDYSYFKGCSTGGRQAVMAAQRYPGDFDGIIAGALANRHVHMHTVGAYRGIRLARHPEEAISEEKAALVNAAVMAACDTHKEGFLSNPRECSFDFATLLCDGGGEGGACLTEPELRTVETFYGGQRTGDGELVFSGQAMGNPLPALASSPEGPGSFAFDTIRILGFQDANYDWRNFDLDRDMPIIDAAAGWVDAVNPDLRAFEGHGGKLLLYAGWRDTGITPENTVLYYESVRAEMGPQQDDWMRLFLAPGMGHCRGGPGVNTFDTLTALERWREQGEAPAQMLATNAETGLARPLCPYPQYAEYKGSGELKDASNWSCAAP
jgi:feruloyl esterase